MCQAPAVFIIEDDVVLHPAMHELLAEIELPMAGGCFTSVANTARAWQEEELYSSYRPDGAQKEAESCVQAILAEALGDKAVEEARSPEKLKVPFLLWQRSGGVPSINNTASDFPERASISIVSKGTMGGNDQETLRQFSDRHSRMNRANVRIPNRIIQTNHV